MDWFGQADVVEVVLFSVFAVIALGAAIAMIAMRNIVHSALMLVVNFLAIAALYLGLQSSFLAIIQVIVYAGAIMVLFLFVIMLLGVDRDDHYVQVRRRTQVAAAVGAAGLAAVLLFVFVGAFTGPGSLCGPEHAVEAIRTSQSQPCVGLDEAVADNPAGGVGVIADRLFTRWTFPFEAAAVLLTVATVGAMMLGRRQEVPPDEEPAFATDVVLPDPDALDSADLDALDSLDDSDEDDGPQGTLDSDDVTVAAAGEATWPEREDD